VDQELGRAVGIENKNRRKFKDLRRMQRNAKSLKRNNEACKGILIAQSSLVVFAVEILAV
jgi:hypothetical protein